MFARDDSDLEEEFSIEIMNERVSLFRDLHMMMFDDGVITIHVPGDVRAVDSPSSNTHGLRADHLHDRQTHIVTDLVSLGFHATKEYTEVSRVVTRNRLSALSLPNM